MNFLQIDHARCIACGACAAVCPIGIIVMGPGPKLVEGGEKACIRCGHCVAVCPRAAFSLEGMEAAACRVLPEDWRVRPEKLAVFLKGRRSVRRYTDAPVDRATLEHLIDVARYAPSGINRQPVYWAVVREKAAVSRVAELTVAWMRSLVAEGAPLADSLRFRNIIAAWEKGADPVTRGAPHLVIAYGLKEDMTAPAAATIALTYFELAAAAAGLGACWAGYVQMAVNMSADVRKAVGLSSRTQANGAMLVGHPRYRYARIPLRNDPRILWR